MTEYRGAGLGMLGMSREVNFDQAGRWHHVVAKEKDQWFVQPLDAGVAGRPRSSLGANDHSNAWQIRRILVFAVDHDDHLEPRQALLREGFEGLLDDRPSVAGGDYDCKV